MASVLDDESDTGVSSKVHLGYEISISSTYCLYRDIANRKLNVLRLSGVDNVHGEASTSAAMGVEENWRRAGHALCDWRHYLYGIDHMNI